MKKKGSPYGLPFHLMHCDINFGGILLVLGGVVDHHGADGALAGLAVETR